MKAIFFFAALFFVTSIFSQDGDPPSGFELNVENGSTNNRELRTRVYPVSMVFNGNDPRQYDLHAKNPVVNVYTYINGRHKYQTEFALIPGTSKGWDFDGINTNGGTVGAVGVGIYKVEFFWNGAWRDSCLVEWDEHNPGDLTLKFLDDNSNPRIVYHWADCNTEAALPSDRKLFAYNQTGCGGISRNKEYGNFLYSTANNNTYTVLPQDFRQDCGNENYPIFDGQYGTGRLFSNLTID